MKMYEAAVEVLRTADDPLHVRDVHQQIISKELFTFGAKNPVSVLSQTMSERSAGGRKGDPPLFVRTAPGTYTLAPRASGSG